MNEQNPVVQPRMEETPQIEQPRQSSEPGKINKQLQEWWMQLKKFGKECKRVMKVTQKPNKEEFMVTAKVSALGMGIVGLIGFVLSMIQQLIL